MDLVSLMCQVYYAKQSTQDFPYFLFCKNKVAVSIAIQWKIVSELIRDVVDEKPLHCLKTFRIQSYSGPYFPAFGLNTERYGVSAKCRPE